MSRKGCTGRGDRWEGRGILKENANRRGSIRSQHPQVRRQIEDGDDQEAEWSFMVDIGGAVVTTSIQGTWGERV